MSGGVCGVYTVDMATGTAKTWSFGGAAYGAGVAVNPDVPYVYAASQDPYSGGIFKYDRRSRPQSLRRCSARRRSCPRRRYCNCLSSAFAKCSLAR
jgi:DNA-binding beta-propeller fold protein YncE